ncbi:hypothetical protein FN846DRAFT_903556 [Sphaerosporella brunnea]|uniref:F-box domain-containing protein n=1 Tax=Sphaerosporella brunnea TaxID=1250544 RepID=A0A5J5F746_9PEZI|nr:hypothetical protein FN846DRAFT_903556 [Sphaerosporella brunnea]
MPDFHSPAASAQMQGDTSSTQLEPSAYDSDDMESLFHTATAPNDWSPRTQAVDGIAGVVQPINGPDGWLESIKAIWSGLQRQQNELLELQRHQLELLHQQASTINDNQKKQLELLQSSLTHFAQLVANGHHQDAAVSAVASPVVDFGQSVLHLPHSIGQDLEGSEHLGHYNEVPGCFAPFGVPEHALTPRSAVSLAPRLIPNSRKRQRLSCSNSPDLHQAIDTQLEMLLRTHSTSVNSSANHPESYQTVAPYNTPDTLTISPTVHGENVAGNNIQLALQNKGVLSAKEEDARRCHELIAQESKTLLDWQPRETLEAAVRWFFIHSSLSETHKGELWMYASERKASSLNVDPEAVYRKQYSLYCEAYNRVGRQINSLIDTMPRRALESSILRFLTHESIPELVKANIRGYFVRNMRLPLENLVRELDLSPIWATQNSETPIAFAYGSMGTFNVTPNCLAIILGYLPLLDVLRLLLSTCRTLRGLFNCQEVWAKVCVENKKSLFTTNGFLAFLRRLPESSIRILTLDLSIMEHHNTMSVLDTLNRKKHWRINSLHVVGRKVTAGILNQIVRRLWSDNIRILSIHDTLGGRMDVKDAIQKIYTFLPRLEKFRVEGVADYNTVKLISNLGTKLDSEQRIVGVNTLTHLSFVGVKSMIDWAVVAEFGLWFPALEELYIHNIVGGSKWLGLFAIHEPVHSGEQANPDSQDTELKSYLIRYRDALPGEIRIRHMPRLRSLVIELFGEDKAMAKKQETLHMAHFWSLIECCRGTLERLELGRTDERFFDTKRSRRSDAVTDLLKFVPQAHQGIPPPPIILPKLEYLFLSCWNIQWHCFVGSKTPAAGSAAQQIVQFPAHLQIPRIRNVAFFHCDGLPGAISKKKAPTPVTSTWLRELREHYPNVQGRDEGTASMETIFADNLGAGSW